jgi:hypothetical protein
MRCAFRHLRNVEDGRSYRRADADIANLDACPENDDPSILEPTAVDVCDWR